MGLIDSSSDPTSPSPLPPSSSSSHSSPAQHYYIAVDRLQFKMEALIDLLGVVGRWRSLPIVLCCSSRDELDAVCFTISNLAHITLSCLYSDLADMERAKILEKFRRSTIEWNQTSVAVSDEGTEKELEECKSHVIVVTDVCLPFVTTGEAPLTARVLINWELPPKKETYLRRMSTCLASDGIVLNMVVGGEVVTLKGLEESTGLVIAEMPIYISEIL